MTLGYKALRLLVVVGLSVTGALLAAAPPVPQPDSRLHPEPALAALTLAAGPQLVPGAAGPAPLAPGETGDQAAAAGEAGDIARPDRNRAAQPVLVSRPSLPDVPRLATILRDGVTLRTLNVPYVNQMYDVPGFEYTGTCACGPASLAMVLAYFGRLEPRPVEIAPP